MPIYRPKELRALGHRPRRSLSQNFLIDQNIIRKTLKVADIVEGDSVLEIGPGPGAITEQLLKAGAHVLAIEKDKELSKRLGGKENLEVHCADALAFPLENIRPGTKLVANLPYHITAPIIERFIQASGVISSMTLFVQREVGLRICAEANTRDYSSFSLFVQCYTEVDYCFTVSSNCFYPPPSVQSCVIHLKLQPFPYPTHEELFFAFTRAAFNQKRKMLRGSLRKYAPPEDIETALVGIGKSPKSRPGELTSMDFASLYQKLNQSQAACKNE